MNGAIVDTPKGRGTVVRQVDDHYFVILDADLGKTGKQYGVLVPVKECRLVLESYGSREI